MYCFELIRPQGRGWKSCTLTVITLIVIAFSTKIWGFQPCRLVFKQHYGDRLWISNKTKRLQLFSYVTRIDCSVVFKLAQRKINTDGYRINYGCDSTAIHAPNNSIIITAYNKLWTKISLRVKSISIDDGGI